MAKTKEVKPVDINENSAIISNKKSVIFDFILLFFIAVPFILLILFGNKDTNSSGSGNQGLTNSWQSVSPALSNTSEVSKEAPSPDKVIPTYPLSTTAKLQ